MGAVSKKKLVYDRQERIKSINRRLKKITKEKEEEIERLRKELRAKEIVKWTPEEVTYTTTTTTQTTTTTSNTFT